MINYLCKELEAYKKKNEDLQIVYTIYYYVIIIIISFYMNRC
jgi:hypothetical protein